MDANSEVFEFNHMMFHQIIGEKEFLWRRCVGFCIKYIEWRAEKEN